MKLFIAAAYSAKVNYDTGEVFPEYKLWLETILTDLETDGHTVFCALREDDYKINDLKPEEAFRLDYGAIESAEAVLAFLGGIISAGVQTEIGIAVALKKPVVIVQPKDTKVEYFNNALDRAGAAVLVDDSAESIERALKELS